MIVFKRYRWDVFICHVTENKEDIIDSLVEGLEKQNLKVCYDKILILDGDILHHKIFEGVPKSRILIVVFSKAFFKKGKTWPWMEIGKFLNKKNDDHLIPLYYNITEKEIEEEEFPPFLSTNKWQIIEDGNIPERTRGIFQKVKYLKSRKRIREALILIFLIIASVSFLTFHNYLKFHRRQSESGTSPIVSNNNYTLTTTHSEKSPLVESQIRKQQNIIPKPVSNTKGTDYPAYVNTLGKVDVSVIVLDDNGNILYPVSSSIADIYNKTGKKTSIGLLKSTFIKKPEFQDLLNGNSDIIDKLKLYNFTDYLVIGKITYTFSAGSLVNGSVVCNASLSVSIISTSTKSIYKSFDTAPAIGNDVTELLAQQRALQKLLDIYVDQYSSI